MIGPYDSLWEAQAFCDRLRSRGGGVTTALLVYALGKGIINEALVVGSSDEEPWARAFVATTPEQVIAAAGSKYTLVSYGRMADVLGHSSAVVGLPCQIRSYRSGSFLKLGLFDGLNLSPRGMRYLLNQLGIEPLQVRSLDYRAPGGGLLVELRDGRIVRYGGYAWLAYFFSYKQCIRCTDNTNHHADISIGDRKPEWCNVIVRTQRGKELFLGALQEGHVRAHLLSLEAFLKGVQTPFFQKELRGGYCSTRLVRARGKWIEHLPLPVLRSAGGLIYRWQRIQAR